MIVMSKILNLILITIAYLKIIKAFESKEDFITNYTKRNLLQELNRDFRYLKDEDTYVNPNSSGNFFILYTLNSNVPYAKRLYCV